MRKDTTSPAAPANAIHCESCAGTCYIQPMYGKGGTCGACAGRGWRHGAKHTPPPAPTPAPTPAKLVAAPVTPA